MNYDTTKWGILFPTQVNGTNRPTTAMPNTSSFDTTDLPQYISTDPVAYDNLNAFLSQLVSNDQRLQEGVNSCIPVANTATNDDIDFMFSPSKIFGSTFDGINYLGTRTDSSVGLSFSPSSDILEGQDDFKDYDPFNTIEALSVADGYGGSKIIAYQGDALFDKYKNDPDFGADVLVGFPLGYMYNYINSNNIITKKVSAGYQSNFIPSPMHLRNNKLYNYVYLTKYGWCDDGKGGVCSRAGYPPKINYSEAQFETISRAKGFTVMGINDVSWIQQLGCVKYNSLNWQTTVGNGISTTYVDKIATVSETGVTRIILSNSDAASFTLTSKVLLSLNTSIFYSISSITAYDANNMAINLNTTTTFNTVSGTTHIYMAPTYSGMCDTILGQDGEISTGSATKRSVLTFNLENFYSNTWKLLSGVVATDNNSIYINPNPDGQPTWPTSATDAVAKGWVKYGANIAQTTGAYVSTFGYDSNFPYLSIPSAVTGTSSAPVGDYFYNQTYTSPHLALFGGVLSYGAGDGPFYLFLGNAVSYSSWSCGAFGVFVPGL